MQDCPFVEFEVVTVVSSVERHQMVWNEFLSSGRTLCSEERDYKEWHKGRREYAAWMIDIQSEPVRSRFDAAREHLAEFLLEPYRRQAHVTLFVCGFLVEVPRFDDDYAVEERNYHLRALREAEIAPFEIKVGGINSFAATPFLEVSDVERRSNNRDRQLVDKDLPTCYLFSINSIQTKGASYAQNRPICKQI